MAKYLRSLAAFASRTASSISSPATNCPANRMRRPTGLGKGGRGIRIARPSARAASSERVEAAVPEQDKDPVEDAQRTRHDGDRPAHPSLVPPLERVREGEPERDHADCDAGAELRLAMDEECESRVAEPGDEQDQQLVVARQAVHDPNAEHSAA